MGQPDMTGQSVTGLTANAAEFPDLAKEPQGRLRVGLDESWDAEVSFFSPTQKAHPPESPAAK